MVEELHPFFLQRRKVMLVVTLRVGCILFVGFHRGIHPVLVAPWAIVGIPCSLLVRSHFLAQWHGRMSVLEGTVRTIVCQTPLGTGDILVVSFLRECVVGCLSVLDLVPV